MKHSRNILLWLAVISASICALVVFDYRETGADILDLSTVQSDTDTEFVNALNSLGHDRIDSYVINGQTIFTSVRHIPGANPKHLLREYQEAFVAHGVNDRAYMSLNDHNAEDRLFTGLKGGLVPFRYSDRHVAMGGVVTPNRARDDAQVLNQLEAMAREPDGFEGHRVVEIMRPEGARSSTAVATWSENFDFDQFLPGSETLRANALEDDVLTCPGCTRVHHLEHPRRGVVERGVHVFTGDRTPAFYRDWFTQILAGQGYERDTHHDLTQDLKSMYGIAMPNEWLSFSGHGLARTVSIYQLGPGDVGIHVHTSTVGSLDEESSP